MSNPLIRSPGPGRNSCEATDLSDVYVIEIVEHGILEPQGVQPKDWRFNDYARLALAGKRAAKLRHDLELEWEGVALALDLLEEVQQLRAGEPDVEATVGAVSGRVGILLNLGCLSVRFRW